MRKLVFLVFIVPTMASAMILHVPADHSTIGAAIAASANGDTVLVANGTYTGDGNRDLDFTGKQILLESESGPDSTILTCQGTITEPHRGFYFHNSEDSTSIISGFKVTGGIAIHNGGGAICCEEASPYLKNCIFTINTAFNANGGAIACLTNSSPIFCNCKITHNSALSSNIYAQGGGLYCGDNSSPNIIDCIFSNNRVSGQYPMGPQNGGAIMIGTGSSPIIIGGTFNNNLCICYGGAICCMNPGSPQIVDCTFNENIAEGYGGAVAVLDSNYATISDCHFQDHLIYGSGAGIGFYYATGTVNGCSFINNTAHGDGAGVYCYESSVSLYNNVFTNDTSCQGGSVCFINSTNCSVSGCRIENNFAGNMGGGMYCENSSINLDSCLFAYNNSISDGGGVRITNCSSSITFCLFHHNFSTESGGLGLMYADPEIDNCTFSGNNSMDPGSGSSIGCYYSNPIINHCILAFTTGRTFYCRDSAPYLSCTDIYGNEYGNWVECLADQDHRNGNFSANPIFCDTIRNNYSLNRNSPCAPQYNSCEKLIGSCDVGCSLQNTSDTTIIPDDNLELSTYPNPFNHTVIIRYKDSQPMTASIDIFNISGQLIKSFRTSSQNSVLWDASDYPSGLYFARLSGGANAKTTKLILLK
jgi:hypothetical protein